MSDGYSYLASAELTDVGRRRKNNEDSVLCLPEHGVFCVADGMGGTQGGEVASQATVDALTEEFTSSEEAPFAVTAKASARLVARALNRASSWIKTRATERGIPGTGSTAVVLCFDRVTPSKALILHAGDSRAYCFRDDRLTQLSKDHSVAAAAGLKEDDKDLPAMFRGVITRAVGLDKTVVLDETPTDVRANDLFLLCSDGLSKMVSDKAVRKLLHAHRAAEVQAIARVLVDAALEAGGEDNVSAVIVRVAPSLPASPTMAVPPETRRLEEERPQRDASPEPSRERAAEDADQTPATDRTAETDLPADDRPDSVRPPDAEPPQPKERITPVTATPAAAGRPASAANAGPPAAATPAKRDKPFITWLLILMALAAAGTAAAWLAWLRK